MSAEKGVVLRGRYTKDLKSIKEFVEICENGSKTEQNLPQHCQLYAPKLGCDMHSRVIEDQSSLKRETLCKIVLKSEFRGKEGLKNVIKANILIFSQLQSLRKRHNRWEKNPKQEKLRLNFDARD